MKSSLLKISLVALSLGVAGAVAQDAPERPERPERPTRGEGQKPSRDQIRIPRGVELPTNVQELVSQFREQRASLLQARREVLSGLQDATKEERKAALEGLREAQREQFGEQRELARDIRRELRDLRRERAGTGDGG